MDICSLTYPAPGCAIEHDEPEAFTWSLTPGVERVYLYVGTAPGLKDIIDTGELPPVPCAYSAPALPRDVKLFARLYSKVAGQWLPSADVPFAARSRIDIDWTHLTFEHVTWAGTQRVVASDTKPYPNPRLIADPAISSLPLPFMVPKGAWFGLTYASVAGKFGNKDRAGYLVVEGAVTVPENIGHFQPPTPLWLPPGFGIWPYFINNTPEDEFMGGVVQGVLVRGIDPAATLRDVLRAQLL